jgi:hypothetical protein
LGNCSPEMAVPMTVKMPEPMTAPMPSAVSDQGPSVFFSACSGSVESLMSLSIDLRAKNWFRAKNWLGRAGLLERQLSAVSYQPSADSCEAEMSGPLESACS